MPRTFNHHDHDHKVSPFLSQLCWIWCMNEPEVWKRMWHANTADILAVAMPRVMAVVTGEVRWSEASAGDKAIWLGRARNAELAKAREHTYANVYDTIVVMPSGHADAYVAHNYNRLVGAGSWHMFGNANVGNMFLTNMQVAGQFWFDRTAVIEQMYAVTDRPITADDNLVLEMIVGMSPVRMLPLHDWCVGVPGPIVIPVRQNFSVRVSTTGRMREPLEIRVHLEGILAPPERTRRVKLEPTEGQLLAEAISRAE